MVIVFSGTRYSSSVVPGCSKSGMFVDLQIVLYTIGKTTNSVSIGNSKTGNLHPDPDPDPDQKILPGRGPPCTYL
jgi:hypothetical protein